MILFWTIALGAALLVAVPIARAMAGRPAAAPDTIDSDVGLYRAQLDEVERDAARGILDGDEVARMRTEVARRLLAADARAKHRVRDAPPAVSLVAAAVAAATVLGGSVALYARIGAPGYPDLPIAARIAAAEALRAERPSQAAAEEQAGRAGDPRPAPDPETAALMERLREALSTRPDDLRGFELLARNEASMGNFAAAARAQARVLDLMGAETTAADLADRAEWMVLAAGGYVSPEAEVALERALDADPRNGRARYYLGLAQAQLGRPDLAYRVWAALLRDGPEEAPWIAPIRAQIPQVAARAGVPYDPPPARPGPDAQAVVDAADMSPEDRDAMIRGMVQGLADRLATQGGPAADWARLIAAYGTLGETDAAAAIWDEGRDRFAGVPADRDLLRRAAEAAGVAQ